MRTPSLTAHFPKTSQCTLMEIYWKILQVAVGVEGPMSRAGSPIFIGRACGRHGLMAFLVSSASIPLRGERVLNPCGDLLLPPGVWRVLGNLFPVAPFSD